MPAARPPPPPRPATGVNYPTGYKGPRASRKAPFGDGKTTFKIVVPEDAVTVGDWNKNDFSAWFEQRTGVKVEYQTVPTTNNDMTKINAMIGAKDLPDAFLNIPFTRDQISAYGVQGVFVAIDDHVDKYAIELKAAMADAPDLKQLSKGTDGRMYVFPSVNDCRQCKVSPGRAWVNQKFIEAADTKIPETADDFRALLKAFKNNDASGHGDTVPFAAGATSAIDRWVMNAFLYNPGEPWLRLDQGKVAFVANKSEWRQGLQFLRTLYDDGTLTPDVFTMTDESLQKLGNNPGHARIGVARTYYWGIFMDIVTQPDARWHDYVPVPALKGPAGVQNAAWDYYQPFLLNSFVITSRCSDPAAMVQWADYQMELEATMRSAWGHKDSDWQWTPKGVKSIEGRQALWRQDVGGSEASVPVGHGWNQHAVMYRSNDSGSARRPTRRTRRSRRSSTGTPSVPTTNRFNSRKNGNCHRWSSTRMSRPAMPIPQSRSPRTSNNRWPSSRSRSSTSTTTRCGKAT